MPLSKEHRSSLAARLRAELSLRLHRLGGHDIESTGKPYFYEGWPIFRAREGTISLGRDMRLRGGPTRTRLITRDGGRIETGEYVGINFGCEITSERLIKIGHYTSIGPHTTIYDTSFHPVNEGEEVRTGPVEIGKNVWIGRDVLILPGVTIGDHSVVASGSIVVKDVPPRTLVAGFPAKPLREIEASDDWRRM
jgi:acetyltransferase-like isoleucine patch superfamily enzyme